MATVRVYEELNDFLPPGRRKRAFEAPVAPGTTVGEVLAGLGIPRKAVDLVLLDGRPAGLDWVLAGPERLVAYPVFEALELGATSPIPGRPLRDPRFFADEHLGRLARYLRLAGFDTRLAQGLDDRSVVEAAEAQGRVLLTRDAHLVAFLRPSRVLVPLADRAAEQFVEVVARLQLEGRARPFTRCLVCNAPLRPASSGETAAVPDRVAGTHRSFLTCQGCGRVYWPGSHHRRMRRLLEAAGIAS